MILGGLASAAIYPVIGANALFFWLASFLIDIDHYLDYVYHNGFRDLGLKGMFDYHNALELFWNEPEFLNMEVFHTVEFLIPFYAISIWTGSTAMQVVFWGFIFHIVLDMVFLLKINILFKRTHSMVEYFVRKRMYAKRGLDTAAIYGKALDLVRKNNASPLKAADGGR